MTGIEYGFLMLSPGEKNRTTLWVISFDWMNGYFINFHYYDLVWGKQQLVRNFPMENLINRKWCIRRMKRLSASFMAGTCSDFQSEAQVAGLAGGWGWPGWPWVMPALFWHHAGGGWAVGLCSPPWRQRGGSSHHQGMSPRAVLGWGQGRGRCVCPQNVHRWLFITLQQVMLSARRQPLCSSASQCHSWASQCLALGDAAACPSSRLWLPMLAAHTVSFGGASRAAAGKISHPRHPTGWMVRRALLQPAGCWRFWSYSPVSACWQPALSGDRGTFLDSRTKSVQPQTASASLCPKGGQTRIQKSPIKTEFPSKGIFCPCFAFLHASQL
mgnify:CR=1 FL=1